MGAEHVHLNALNDKMDRVLSELRRLHMTIRKRGGGYAVVHCHGKKKGRTIAKHRTKAGAEAQHRAIQANKKQK